MSLTDFRLPALGADMDAGTVVEWKVEPGQTVKRGDVVAVVETDKGAIDVEIFLDGVVRELVVPVGTRVPVGTALARVETAGEAMPSEDVSASAAAGAAMPSEDVSASAAPAGAPVAPPAGPSAIGPQETAGLKVSPAARRRARELAVDLAAVTGSGPGGAITIDDVERAHAAPAEPRAAMREAIATAMSHSKREIPHYYLTASVDVTPVLDWLAAHNAAVPVTERLLLPAVLVKALALACRELAGFSGLRVEGRYVRGESVHVGVAVALRGGGLVAPAILETDTKPLATVMAEFRDLVTRARAGRLRASELAAPTVILTSLGDEAPIEAMLPIIQPPQVAIVGAGAVLERPWVVDGAIVPRRVLTLSLAADHRVTDGRLGAQFLGRVAAKLAHPEAL